MAGALRRVLIEPELAARMGAQAAALAPQLLWPAVAGRYRELAGVLLDQRAGAVA
jgi:polysaccharide biosynthesis protein PslF